jgi:hypothetical protein
MFEADCIDRSIRWATCNASLVSGSPRPRRRRQRPSPAGSLPRGRGFAADQCIPWVDFATG